MSKPIQTVSLGEIDPARSRHHGRRSAVAVADDRIYVGTADGCVRAFDTPGVTEAWSVSGGAGSVVALAPLNDGIAVGKRGAAGSVQVYNADGSSRWQYDTAADIGEPTKETRVFLPFIASLATDGESLFVAARRYERDGETRSFESVIYAIDSAGAVRWQYETDASPISLDLTADRLAVAYNRCPGGHQHGLVVLDAETGSERCLWDPGTEGQRRVGDVSLVDETLFVASHGDYRGYCLDSTGTERWAVDLGRPQTSGAETVYTYPNHVYATEAGVVFVTGNTYPETGRETAERHPNEHTALGIDLSGEKRWQQSVGGFASGVGEMADMLLVPAAQNFRERDPTEHACWLLDVANGAQSHVNTEGVVTAVAGSDGTVAAVEEPVVYHDDGDKRGSYRLHCVE